MCGVRGTTLHPSPRATQLLSSHSIMQLQYYPPTGAQPPREGIMRDPISEEASSAVATVTPNLASREPCSPGSEPHLGTGFLCGDRGPVGAQPPPGRDAHRHPHLAGRSRSHGCTCPRGAGRPGSVSRPDSGDFPPSSHHREDRRRTVLSPCLLQVVTGGLSSPQRGLQDRVAVSPKSANPTRSPPGWTPRRTR